MCFRFDYVKRRKISGISTCQCLMRWSNRNFNIPPPGRKPQAFELLKIESFKFWALRAKMVFKCPTLSSDFVCQMPLLKNTRRRFLSVMKLGYDHGTQRTRIHRQKWKQTLQGKPCVTCFWQTAGKSPRILRFFALFFRVGHEQVLYRSRLPQWKQGKTGPCEWKLP